jgi:hypothetical protein
MLPKSIGYYFCHALKVDTIAAHFPVWLSRLVEEAEDLLGQKLELAILNKAGKLVREDEKPMAKAYGRHLTKTLGLGEVSYGRCHSFNFIMP